MKDPSEYSIVGTPRSDVDLSDLMTGAVEFGLDKRLPGMLYAVIEKAPTYGGRPRSIDGSRALAVPGVREVVEITPLNNPILMVAGVAVVADNSWAAMKGREALIVEWADGPHPDESSDSLRAQFERLTLGTGEVIRDNGDVDAALASAAQTLNAVYEVPFLYHASMEPMNCVADVRADSCEIWAPTQAPGGCLGLAALITGLPRDSITVHMMRTGGGFGRRLMSDFAAEAVFISQAVGNPVQVLWTREDDMRHGYYRPAGLYRLSGGNRRETGTLIAWQEHASTTSRNAFRGDEDTAAETEVFADALPGAVGAELSARLFTGRDQRAHGRAARPRKERQHVRAAVFPGRDRAGGREGPGRDPTRDHWTAAGASVSGSRGTDVQHGAAAHGP